MPYSLAETTSGSGSPIYLLHGFTQNRNCWGNIATTLAASSRVTAFDLPGHGGSSGCPPALVEGAELLASGQQRGSWIGYSLGGRYALHVALTHPELVSELVLIGAHPGIVDPSEREQRHAEDTTRACTIIVEGVSKFLDSWLDLPLFAGLAPEDQDREERETNSVEGLVSSLMFASTGVQENLWPRLPELEMPVKLVVGEHDQKFLELAKQCKSAIGDNARLCVIGGAGHSAHRENPGAFLSAVSSAT
ncbi:MAG: alpha/beta fold hydrolase [Acidimicrobiales bacterium]